MYLQYIEMQDILRSVGPLWDKRPKYYTGRPGKEGSAAPLIKHDQSGNKRCYFKSVALLVFVTLSQLSLPSLRGR